MSYHPDGLGLLDRVAVAVTGRQRRLLLGDQRLELGLESIELPAELDRVRSFRALGRLVLGELRAARNGGVLEKKGAV